MLQLEEVEQLGRELSRLRLEEPARRVRLYWVALRHACLRLREAGNGSMSTDMVVRLEAKSAAKRALAMLPELQQRLAGPVRSKEDIKAQDRARELKLYWLLLSAGLVEGGVAVDLIVEEAELEDWRFLFEFSVAGRRPNRELPASSRCCGALTSLAAVAGKRAVRCTCGRRWLEPTATK